MTLEQAVEKMKKGEKVTHKFMQGATIENGLGTVVTLEDGVMQSLQEFISLRTHEAWHTGWSLWHAPKTDWFKEINPEHLKYETYEAGYVAGRRKAHEEVEEFAFQFARWCVHGSGKLLFEDGSNREQVLQQFKSRIPETPKPPTT